MLSTRPLKIVNPLPAPPSRDRASSASVAYQRNQGTKPPSRRFTSAVTAASNVVVTKLGLERRAAASSRRLANRRGPGVRAILALVDHSTAALERHRRDASCGGRREVARDRPLSVRRTSVLTRPDSPHLDIWRDSPDNSSSSREASLNPSPLACSYHARAAATSGSNSVAPSFFNIMGS